jgi:hypothetical protein
MNRPWMFGSIGLLIVSLAGVAQAEPPEPQRVPSPPEPRVGVVVTLSVNATGDETQRLSAALGQALEDKFLVDAVTGKDLPEVDVPDDCLAERACVRDIARSLGVDQVLLLTVVRVGERFQVAVTWGDGADGRTVSRVSIDIDVEQQDPGPVFAVYARRLLPDAAPRPDPVRPDPVRPDPIGSQTHAGRAAGGPAGSAGDDRDVGRRMTGGAWIAAGVGAVFLAGGIGFGLSARSAYNQLDGEDCRTLTCSSADIDRVESRARLADICVGAAVLAGATAAILYMRSGKRVHIRGVDVAAYGTGRDFGVTVGGRF